MAFVRIYYHREPRRIAPHVRYIARRPESDGLHGLGPAFRELRGDLDACVRLIEAHAAQARTHTAQGQREGPFVRLLFTLPADLAARVARADAPLPDGARLVLRDAVEATFRSVGRHLQGVYAVHFHAQRRAVPGHVHVDLSPLDTHGRTTFVPEDQRERFRSVWEREVGRAVERVEKRARDRADPDPLAGRGDGRERRVRDGARAARSAAREHEPVRVAHGGAVGPERRPHSTPAARASAPTRARHPSPALATLPSVRRQRVRYVPFVTEWLLGRARLPLVDLFLRALAARTERRRLRRAPALAVRFALGLPVPRFSVRPTAPLPLRHVRLRVPYLP